MSTYHETVVLQGHIIDSLILAKVLDRIVMMGGTFDLQDVNIGKTREQSSSARIVIRAASKGLLDEILNAIQPHGASIEPGTDCRTEPVPDDGILPDTFYATTHLPTQIRIAGRRLDVDPIEMDLAIVVNEEGSAAHAIPMGDVRRGDRVIVGREGIRVIPLQRPQERDVFGFMEFLRCPLSGPMAISSPTSQHECVNCENGIGRDRQTPRFYWPVDRPSFTPVGAMHSPG